MTMPMRAYIALALVLSTASPAIAESSAGRASAIDGDTAAEGLRLDGGDFPESGQHCGEVNETNHRCGVGTEWAVTDRVSIRSEAHYSRLQDDSISRGIAGAGETKRIEHVDSWVGRIGVNFKLGGKAHQAH
jgi:hypothetical protein